MMKNERQVPLTKQRRKPPQCMLRMIANKAVNANDSIPFQNKVLLIYIIWYGKCK